MEELDLKELFYLFWSKKVVMILIVLVLMLIGTVYSYFFITPEYTAVTTILLAQASTNTQETGITTTDLTINSKLITTYSSLIKKDIVLGQVASNLNLTQAEVDKIKRKVSVTTTQGTDILEIRVRDEDPNYSSQIANEIATVFVEKIPEIYNISNLYLLDRAKIPTQPSNINHKKDITIFALIGFVIAIFYVIVCNMLDTTIKTEEDIEKIEGLVVLTTIPNYDAELNKEKKGGKR